MRALFCAPLLLAAVAVPGPLSTAAAAPAPGGLASYRHVEVQVFGDVAVGMPTGRVVKIQHRDPATGLWDAPTTLYTTKRSTCGFIEGQASPGGVALLLACDRYFYEDQAPTRSVALVSRDGRSWASHRLDGEAYQQPTISPRGEYAAWLVGRTGHYVEWSASTGFGSELATTYTYGGGETPVVDDTGTVTVIGPEGERNGCAVGVHTRDLAGIRTSTTVPGVDAGCGEGSFETVDALTVTGGGYDAASRFTLARADTASPWALTRIRPADAPGLSSYSGGRKRLPTVFVESSTQGRPLVAVGGPDRRHLLAQTYDAATPSWGPQSAIYTADRDCRSQDILFTEPRALYVTSLRCGRRQVVLGSADARAWTVAEVGRRPWVLAGDRLALPDASGTTVLAADGTTRRYAATTDGTCDVVYPAAPGVLLRLHGGRGWPTRVQQYDGTRFRTVSRTRRITDTCRRVVVDNTFAEPTVYLSGRRSERIPRFVLRDGVWGVRYPKDPLR